MKRNSGRISILNRLITACISAVIITIMAFCAPLAILVFARGHGVGIISLYSTFHIWGASVALVAGVVGFVLGDSRTIVLFGYLWNTEQPKRIGLTLFLWIALISIGLIGYWVSTY